MSVRRGPRALGVPMAANQANELPRSDPLNRMPPLPQACVLGLQHVLAMFAGNITVPIVIADAIGLTLTEKALLVQATLWVAGLATLIQTVGIGPFGARLPLVLGTSFAYVAIAIPLGASLGVDAIIGGVVVAGCVQLLSGGCIKWIRFLFPPVITGLFILLIGIQLLPLGFTLAAGGTGAEDFGSWHHLTLASVVFVTLIVVNQYASGFASAAAVIIALALGCGCAMLLGQVDLGSVREADWLSLPDFFAFGVSFPSAAVIGFGMMALVVTTETIGDISGTTIAGLDREPTEREISGGILADGAGSTLAGVFGSLPLVTYSQNVGIVALTGVVSRHVVTISAIFLCAAGMFPKLGAIIVAMPASVLGGAAIVMFGLVAAAGVRMLLLVELDRRNMLIIGVGLTVGIGVPAQTELLAELPMQLRLLLESGLIPGALSAMALHLLLPRTSGS